MSTKKCLKSYRIASSPYVVSQHHFGYPALMLREETNAREINTTRNEELERYFNDLYFLFMNKFSRIPHDPSLNTEDEQKLNELFREIILVKKMLGK